MDSAQLIEEVKKLIAEAERLKREIRHKEMNVCIRRIQGMIEKYVWSY